ncbi:MAG: hypothetical protein Pg6A_10390 [Termitinemataceae bacterium]|nr:MAG: hypothetical protein Pg6A_10390 [Termitinemataceae bacterium]
MAKKKFWLGMLVMTFALCCGLTSCFSTGNAREAIPRTAITLQRVRETTTLLGEVLGKDVSLDTPLQIFLNDEPHELANGESKTITVINGSYVAYAVLGNVESKSIKFTAASKTLAINVSLKRGLLGRMSLEIEVK